MFGCQLYNREACPQHLVEPARLTIPLLDRIERRLAREIEHEQDGHGIVADEWKHVHKLALPAKVPDGECDRRPSHRDCLLHKVDALTCEWHGRLARGYTCVEKRGRTQRLDIILIEAPLDVLDHQARLSDLRVPNHA